MNQSHSGGRRDGHSADLDVGGGDTRTANNGITANNPAEHPDTWTRSYYARQRMSREEQMDDFLTRIGEPSHKKKSGLPKEDSSLRFVHLPCGGAPFQGAFMTCCASSNDLGTDTPHTSRSGGGRSYSEAFKGTDATENFNDEDATDVVFGEGKGKGTQPTRPNPPWTGEEDGFLCTLVSKHGGGEWAKQAAQLNTFLTEKGKDTTRTAQECYGRWKTFLEALMEHGVQEEAKRRYWSTEDLAQLWYAVQASPDKTWMDIASVLPGKTPEQCREGWRYVPWKWTQQQDEVLLHAFMALGPRWNEVVKLFPGHTEDDVRIRTYSPTLADKWKTFSSTVAPGGSFEVVTRIQASLTRAAATSARAAPITTATPTSVNLTKTGCASSNDHGIDTPRTSPSREGGMSSGCCNNNASEEETHDILLGKGKGKQRASFCSPWTDEEDCILSLSVQEHGGGEWSRKAAHLNAFLVGTKKDTRRTAEQCFGRWKAFLNCWMKEGVRREESNKTSWSTEQLAQLWGVVQASPDMCLIQGKLPWTEVASALPGKTPEQCKEGWRHVPWRWTRQQDELLLHAYMALGTNWEQVAKLFPQHTEDDVRIRTYSPARAKMWKLFSSRVAPGESLQLVREVYASLARETDMSTTAPPVTTATATSTDLSKKSSPPSRAAPVTPVTGRPVAPTTLVSSHVATPVAPVSSHPAGHITPVMASQRSYPPRAEPHSPSRFTGSFTDGDSPAG